MAHSLSGSRSSAAPEQDEAAAASELSENTKIDETFYVPKIYWEKVSKRVLTMEKINGTPADKIKKLIDNNFEIISLKLKLSFK